MGLHCFRTDRDEIARGIERVRRKYSILMYFLCRHLRPRPGEDVSASSDAAVQADPLGEAGESREGEGFKRRARASSAGLERRGQRGSCVLGILLCG